MSEHESSTGSGAAPRVAFQGEHGAFSEEAVQTCFGADGAMPVPCYDFAELGSAVLDGRAEYGMLPVENSIAGGVAPAYDMLAATELIVVGEVVQPIRLCLLGVPGAATAGVRRVLSHPVALAQCQTFLRTLGEAETLAVHDTAGAARIVAERAAPETVAVACRAAARRYGLEIMAEDIQDRADNQTRFFVVARPGAPAPAMARWSGGHRTALLLATAHRPGALVAVLTPLARAGVNLTRIESRPAAEPWQYHFFLELDADAGDRDVAAAIEEAAAEARELRMLGSFRRLDQPSPLPD
jgi:prephenate dehydratase